MRTVQVLTLLLALSAALNVAFAAALTARLAGASPAQAAMSAAAAASTVMAIFFTAVSAYRLPPTSAVHQLLLPTASYVMAAHSEIRCSQKARMISCSFVSITQAWSLGLADLSDKDSMARFIR